MTVQVGEGASERPEFDEIIPGAADSVPNSKLGDLQDKYQGTSENLRCYAAVDGLTDIGASISSGRGIERSALRFQTGSARLHG
jgi:hypothetical protein